MATQALPPTRAGKYVTFQISRQFFAVEARRVRQIAPARDMVPLVHASAIIRGALLVRGRRIPVVDIRQRLGLKERPIRAQSSVLLLDMGHLTGLPAVGIVADKMTDVLEFRDRDFRDKVIQLRTSGRPYGRPKTLLDIDQLLSSEDIRNLKSIF
jgi:purine-binding chemotaxis protein CheW